MKNLILFIFISIAFNINAQDTKKDTTKEYNYDVRFYEPRCSNHKLLSVDHESKHNNPYKFAEQKSIVIDSTFKQPAYKRKNKTVMKRK